MLGGHFKRSPEGLEASLAAFPGAMQGWGAVRGVDRRHPEEIQDSWMSLYFLEEKRWRQQGHRSRDDFWSGWLNYKEPPSLQGPVATGFQTERTQNMGLPGPHPSQPARLPHLQGPTPPRVPISLPPLHSIPMRKTKVSGPGKEAYITQDGEESPIWGGGMGGAGRETNQMAVAQLYLLPHVFGSPSCSVPRAVLSLLLCASGPVCHLSDPQSPPLQREGNRN